MSKKALKRTQQRNGDLQKTLEIVALAVDGRKPKKDVLERMRRVTADRRLAYVRAAEHHCFDMRDSISFRIVISEVARQRGEFPAPSIATVRRWMALINDDGTLPSPLSFKTCQGKQQSGKDRIYED